LGQDCGREQRGAHGIPKRSSDAETVGLEAYDLNDGEAGWKVVCG